MFIERFPGHSPEEHLNTMSFHEYRCSFVRYIVVRCDTLDAQHLVLI